MKSLRVVLALLAFSGAALAGVPDWFRQAAAEPVPAHSAETEAVVLLDEGRTVVKDSGEIRGYYRIVYKILRPQGREIGNIRLCSDSDTRIGSLKAWSLTAQGVEYEIKEKDAVETGFEGGGELFSDMRCKQLVIPGADVGSVIGYEYERKERPYVLEDLWWFQTSYPVRRSRLVLQLPPTWEHRIFWMNHEPVPAGDLGNNTWAFELRDLPAIEFETGMPPLRTIAPHIGIKYFPPNGGASSWDAIGAWAGTLIHPRAQATPAMQQKVAELTAGLPGTVDKIRVLSQYVQREVRYVAIEIGIGGYQPHLASDVFANRWGDCKDKANLLLAMLRLAGVESHLVLVNTRRGEVTPEHPFVNFNHAILAIKLPAASAEGLYATTEVPGLGRLLFFDPTDETMEFGNLPGSEQSNHGLVVTEKGGVLVKMPMVAPEQNRLERFATLTVSSTGALAGQVREVYTGSEAAQRRAQFLRLDTAQRKKRLETFLSMFVPSSDITEFDVKDLDQPNKPFTLTYSFSARNYAKPVGNLLLVRPRVLGAKGEDAFEDQHKRERRYPVEFDNLTLQTDHIEITLPAGYVPDEVPEPLSIDPGPVSYLSKVEVKDNILRYDREYRVKEVYIGSDRLQELKKFYRQLAGEEQNAVVLKKQ
jgi:hypothetical protein